MHVVPLAPSSFININHVDILCIMASKMAFILVLFWNIGFRLVEGGISLPCARDANRETGS